MRTAATILVLAATLRADSAQDAAEAIRKAAAALREGNAPALWLLFDPKMPGYGEFRKQSQALLTGATIDSDVDFVKNEGDDRTRTLELGWRMEISQTQRIVSTTTRQARVVCKLTKTDTWKIVSFTPADFFAPTRAAQIWDAISNAAEALNSSDEDRPVSPARFLEAFDSKMPGYSDLVQGITGLTRMGVIESSVELLSNSGDEQARTVEVDWSLLVLNAQAGIYVLRKEQRLKFQMAWEGKRWRIVSAPAAFFSPGRP